MSDEIITSLVLITPLVLSGILHMISVKLNLISKTARPIWQKGFGSNKTYRGFILMPFFTILSFFLIQKIVVMSNLSLTVLLTQSNPFIVGASLGIMYVLFELPNSYLKRKLGILPGELSKDSVQKIVFFILDHIDSLTGCVLVYIYIYGFSYAILYLYILAPLIHIFVNFILWIFKIRKEVF